LPALTAEAAPESLAALRRFDDHRPEAGFERRIAELAA
jgi:hypothetical protein